MMHINVCGVAGERFEDANKSIHIRKLANKPKVDEELVLVVTTPHAGDIAGITCKPPARLEAFYSLNIFEGLNPRSEIT